MSEGGVHHTQFENKLCQSSFFLKLSFALKSLSKANTTNGNNGYNTKGWKCEITVAHEAETNYEAYVIASIYMYKTFMV